MTSNGWSGDSQGRSAQSVDDYSTSIAIEKQFFNKDITSVLSVVPHGGDYYMGFATTVDGSTGDSTYSCYQDVDISGNATDIDNNTMLFSLSGWLCATGGNTAKISIKELDASKNVVSTSTYDQSVTTDTWTQVTFSGAVLPSVRYLEVTITGTHSACGLAAFDDLSLIISSNLDAPPVVTSVSDQTIISGNTLGPLSFAVSDSDTSFSNLTITANSSNTSLIPDDHILVNISDGNGILSLSAISGQTGESLITVSVSDGTKTTITTFTVTVNPDVQMGVNLVTNGTGNSLSGWTDPSSRFYLSSGSFTHSWQESYYMYQEINIGKFSALIDAGFLTYTASCDVNGSGNMQLIFLNSAGIEISESGASSESVIPNGTCMVRVKVGGTSGCTIDNVNFVINSTDFPRTTSIANQSVNSGSDTGDILFTVGYSGSSAVISATSSNSAVVPDSQISFGGNGYQRTVCVTPIAGMSGSSTITISVNGTAVTSFMVDEILSATEVTVSATDNVTSVRNGRTLQMTAMVAPIGVTIIVSHGV